MNFLLDIGKNEYADKIIETKGLAETLGFGGQMFLLGIMTVFAVLSIICICLYVFKFVFTEKKDSKVSKVETVAEEAVVTADESSSYNNDEIIAVIAAAIATAEEECQGAKFRVVSFRRK